MAQGFSSLPIARPMRASAGNARPLQSRSHRRCRATPLRVTASGQNVLLLGSGGREHALAWKLAQSPDCGRLFVAPGNAGTALEPNMTTVSGLNPSNHKQVIDFCRGNGIQLVVVGPEQYLVEGVVDALTEVGVAAFGPSAAAAALEGSKAFMKGLTAKHGIPSAGYGVFTDPREAKAFIRAHGAPIVVKTSGLAAGKGVTVAHSLEEAYEAVDAMLTGGAYGRAGEEVVVEEFLTGEEASFFAFVDGETVIPLVGAQDHKAVGEGDTGPNTGGMGSYSPAPVLTPQLVDQAMQTIMYPTARGMCSEGRPFRGVLFAGFMIEGSQVKLLEHNVRFGDPECQSLMVRLRSDLLSTLHSVIQGEPITLDWDPRPSLTVVMAAKGYPGSYRKDQPIMGLESVTGAKVFHAGTRLLEDRRVSAGGRVLGVTALGDDVQSAQRAAYSAVDAISFPDGFCRRDIGWRAIARG
ncbi:hypothetical protein APUTEX25_002302 [Auxenochlorella protothecoides]|uniref:phosphoribosylamine--glycine ligase n=1 Tax=Auxenochlorella protothecoides TaxID=3075 RepID=A0A3M7L518_AUXPR|nr:hypothetical protein APUTEX25_002302 [Auxenochlorella protothecoides]|eukprot:RMZ57070.1 hypothetical protein APUTEX25_002302 [Auxenochlorella protothecoides]